MNFQDVIRNVYDQDQNLLRTSGGSANSTVFIGNPTLYAVVNTEAASLTGNVTLNPSPNFIGIVTVANPGATSGNVTLDPGSKTQIVGNVTLSDSKAFIGLVTAVGNFGNTGNTTLNPSPNFIGIVTVANPSSFSGNITLDVGSKTQVVGNLTLSDSKGFIGLVTTQAADSKSYIGLVTVTQASSARTITGNVTLSDAKTNIGLVTLTGGTAWTDPKTYIGLVTITGSLTAASGNVTLDAGSKTQIAGNVTLSDSKGFIGLTTSVIGNTPSVTIGSVTVGNLVSAATIFAVVNTSAPGVGNSIVTVANTPLQTQIIGNVTLSDAKTNIGLVTLTGGTAWTDPKTYIGLVTITGSLSAAAGNVTLDAGSKTGIVGNITLSDAKTGIGLVSVFGGNLGIIGNVTLSDAKTYIGLTTVTLDNSRNIGLLGNITISDSKAYIGLVTATLAGSNATIAPFGKFLSSLSLASIDSGAFGPMILDQFGRQVLGDGKTYVGLATVDIGSQNSIAVKGNVTLSDSKTYIGLVSISHSAWSNPNTYIGLVTADIGTIKAWANPNTYLGLVTVDIGASKTISVAGNVTLSDSKGYIGLVTVSHAAWANPNTFIGLVTVDIGASKTVTWAGNVTLSDAKTYIGLTTTTLGIGTQFIGLVTVAPHTLLGSVTLADAKTYIGLVTNTTGVGTSFIGLVTANTINTGTNKTFVSLPVGLGQNSLSTVAVPTNSNKIKVTQLILSSNVTTDIALKSGVTYLTGNASLGITLFPGGGFEMPGSPDSPVWISLPSGALVVEKRDPGGTTSKIGGGVIYFDET